MKKSLILRFALWTLQFSRALMFLSTLVVILMTVHWHFDRSFYEQIYLVNGFQAGLNTFNLKLSSEPLTNVSLGSLTRANMYWQVFRGLLIISLGVYSLSVILQVVHSIRSVSTFYDQNIRSLRTLACIGLMAAFIALFNFAWIDGQVAWHFTIPFQPLAGAAICLVFCEVFKEGKRLQDDSDSIV